MSGMPWDIDFLPDGGATPAPPVPPRAPRSVSELIAADDLDDPTIDRCSPYRPAFVKMAEMLCGVMAATDFELSEFFHVSPRTIVVWRMRHPEFRAACALGIEQASDRVVRGLFARAVGYEHQEEKIFCNKHGEIIRADTIKHYPPDVEAAKFWLTNRRKKEWANKTSMELQAPELVSVDDIVNKLFQGVAA